MDSGLSAKPGAKPGFYQALPVTFHKTQASPFLVLGLSFSICKMTVGPFSWGVVRVKQENGLKSPVGSQPGGETDPPKVTWLMSPPRALSSSGPNVGSWWSSSGLLLVWPYPKQLWTLTGEPHHLERWVWGLNPSALDIPPQPV